MEVSIVEEVNDTVQQKKSEKDRGKVGGLWETKDCIGCLVNSG